MVNESHEIATRLALGGLRDELIALQVAIEALPVGIVVAEARPDGSAVVVANNSAFERIVGERVRADSPLSTLSCGMFNSGREVPMATSDWPAARAARTGEVIREQEIHLRRGDGEWRVLEVSAVPMRSAPPGSVCRAVSVLLDVTERSRAEARLRRYQLLAEHTRDLVLFVRRDDGRILDANRAACAAYGFSAEELQALSIFDLRDPTTREAASAQMSQAAAGGILFDTVHRRKDGSSFPVEVNSTGVSIDGTPALVSVIRDVTERTQAQGELRRSEAQLSTIVENLGEGVIVADLRGNLVHWNRAALEMHGFSRLEEAPRLYADLASSFELAPPRGEALSLEQRPMARIFAGESLRDCELRIRSRQAGWTRVFSYSGSLAHDPAGRPLVAVVTVRDVTARRRADEALIAERERLAVTLRSIGDAVIATDAQACITELNDTAATLTGWTAKEVVGRRLEDVFCIIDENTRAPAQNPVDRVLREGTVIGLSNHTVLVSRDGAERPIASSGAPIRDSRGRIQGVVLVFRDKTEERRSEQAIRQGEARYRQLFENIGEQVTIFQLVRDAHGEIVDWIVREQNREAAKATVGASPLGRRLTEILGEEEARHFIGRTGEVLRTGCLIDEDISLRASGHRYRASLFRLDEDTIVAAAIDITEQRQAAEALQRSEQRFRALIEKSTDIIAVVDGGLRIRFWSPSATEVLGWTASEVLGRSVRDLGIVEPDDLPLLAQERQRLSVDASASARVVVRFRRRDGGWRLMEALARNRIDDPAVNGFVVNLRDITEQRRLEEQLRQSQKLESVGRLAGGIAHDFNNLLTVIMSCCEALREELGPARPGIEIVDEIKAAGTRAGELTRQLLAFARRQVIAPVPLDLNEVVSGSERLLRRVLRENIHLLVNRQPRLWNVHCDPGQIEQVILNLAVNARDAMPSGGRLVIETSNLQVRSASQVQEPSMPPGDYVCLRVRDTGVGMTPDIQECLFEPFFTTKEVGKGTGLGLATVYGIVKQSGGFIRVESQPGCGATFEICFPRSGDVATRNPTASQALSHTGSETILLVEDNAAVREVAVRALRSAGYSVRGAGSGLEALDLVERHGCDVQLLVTDVVMPGMDGRTLASALREKSPDLRVLFVSGYAQDTIDHRGVPGPAMSFLPKPFTPTVLLARVRAILDEGTFSIPRGA
ncbi:MAG TPA: PAS domain S-box protein [Anaeromyxobacter sp.]|nr:PAS domain S-box protein [Anaeromyxobacter sp.]